MRRKIIIIIILISGLFLVTNFAFAAGPKIIIGGEITSSMGLTSALRILMKNSPVSLGDLLTVKDDKGRTSKIFSGLAIGNCKKDKAILGLGITFKGYGVVTFGYCGKGKKEIAPPPVPPISPITTTPGQTTSQ